jgi:hypothetical protein
VGFIQTYFQLLVYITSTHPVNNLQSLLRQPIFDKTRRVAFHKMVRQRNNTNWFLPVRENKRADDLDSLHAIMKMIITKGSLLTDDAKLRHFDAAV